MLMKEAMLASDVWLILQQSWQQYPLHSALEHWKELNKDNFNAYNS